MCRATLGASPVSSFTLAASASFSWMVRGVPGVPKTLNRVPELPNAQDGSSITCSPSRSVMAAKDVIFWDHSMKWGLSSGLRTGLALDRACGHTFDDLAVEEDEHHQRWDGHQQD